MGHTHNHDEWLLNHSIERFSEQAETMAKRLRDAAAEIERDAQRIVTDADVKFADEISRASWIVNSINFTFANLASQDLIVRAAELKNARAALETETVETDEAE